MKIEFQRQASILDCDELENYHCGILGFCAIIESHPYDIPVYVPGLLMELAKHLHLVVCLHIKIPSNFIGVSF